MRPPPGIRFLLPALAGTLPLAASGAAPEPSQASIEAVWTPVEIRYSYVGFTTSYGCDAFETKVKNILTTLGAPATTRVQAHCPELNRPSRNFFVTIKTATPVPPGDAPTTLSKSQQELIERLGGKKELPSEPFPAIWKTIDLAHDRRLDLAPGDCELMRGLIDDVLPKLSVKVLTDNVQCTPKQLSIQTPELTVSALVPAPSPDQPSTR